MEALWPNDSHSITLSFVFNTVSIIQFYQSRFSCQMLEWKAARPERQIWIWYFSTYIWNQSLQNINEVFFGPYMSSVYGSEICPHPLNLSQAFKSAKWNISKLRWSNSSCLYKSAYWPSFSYWSWEILMSLGLFHCSMALTS